YLSDLARFLDFTSGHLGKSPTLRDLDRLRPADFRAWLAARANGGAGLGTRARGLSVVRGFYRWLARVGLADNPAVTALKSPRVPRPVPRALDAGDALDLLDTAPAYGTAEQRLGGLLRGWRDGWIIVTKAGEEFADGRSRFDFSPEAITASVERSLLRLRTDRIDVVLLHSDGIAELDFKSVGSFDALARLKKAGKVRAFGASTRTPQGAALAVQTCGVVMLTLNPRDRQDEPMVEAAARRGVGVLIKKALLSGHVADLPGHETGDPIQRCLRFVFAHDGVSSVVVGTIDAEHLAHDVAAAERAIADPT
ncbi:MAG: aldo/keto reductase, partial [Planctomycetes bacterium]|nr:aldo/keto reductase [Planctomycetota bacterium]